MLIAMYDADLLIAGKNSATIVWIKGVFKVRFDPPGLLSCTNGNIALRTGMTGLRGFSDDGSLCVS